MLEGPARDIHFSLSLTLVNKDHKKSSNIGLSLSKSPFSGFSGSKGLSAMAGAGFVGGAVAGAASVSIYHKYLQYQMMLSCHSSPVSML